MTFNVFSGQNSMPYKPGDIIWIYTKNACLTWFIFFKIFFDIQIPIITLHNPNRKLLTFICKQYTILSCDFLNYIYFFYKLEVVISIEKFIFLANLFFRILSYLELKIIIVRSLNLTDFQQKFSNYIFLSFFSIYLYIFIFYTILSLLSPWPRIIRLTIESVLCHQPLILRILIGVSA